MQVQGETLADIVQIESLSGQELEPCTGTYTDRERVWLRIARLTWEGKIVEAARGPFKATSQNENPPGVIALHAHTLDVGGAEVPIRELRMRHPAMTSMPSTVQPDGQTGGARKFEMAVPPGERLAAWCPELCEVSDDTGLAQPATWNLIDIDPATFPL